MWEQIAQGLFVTFVFGLLAWIMKKYIDKSLNYPTSDKVIITEDVFLKKVGDIADRRRICRSEVDQRFEILSARLEEKEKSLTLFTKEKAEEVEKNTMKAIQHTHELIKKDLEHGADKMDELTASLHSLRECVAGFKTDLGKMTEEMKGLRRDLPKRRTDNAVS